MPSAEPSIRTARLAPALRLRSLYLTRLLYLALPLILLAAATLRLIGLGDVGFNSDEAVYSGQAAAISGDEQLSQFFPIFRAHPLLVQFLTSLLFSLQVSDLLARSLSAGVGILTVLLAYAIGKHLYGRKAGIFAALFLALMPYHVVVSRQILLDGSMTLFATLTVYFLARYSTSQQSPWLYAAGASMGLTFLSKETGIVLLAAFYAFFALSPSIRVRLKDLAISMACMLLVILPFPLTLALAGGGGAATTQQYLVWQLLRRPNHEWDFYPTVVSAAIGPLLILVAVLGLWLLRKERSWRDTLLLSWIVIPLVFFQAWPVKGFHYLLLIAPPIAILAGRTLGRWEAIKLRRSAWIGGLLAAAVALSLAIPSWNRTQPSATGEFLAGSGGVPGGREAGIWVNENSPEGASLMTIGPSMANILQFYGHRRAMGLSVSPNPLHRNPAYQAIRNPDFEIRTGEFQYLVWDAYSAARSSFFSEKLLNYAQRYNGRVVHTESISTVGPGGESVEKPVIVIYEVRP